MHQCNSIQGADTRLRQRKPNTSSSAQCMLQNECNKINQMQQSTQLSTWKYDSELKAMMSRQ